MYYVIIARPLPGGTPLVDFAPPTIDSAHDTLEAAENRFEMCFEDRANANSNIEIVGRRVRRLRLED